jgi:hypothetical protein
MAVRFDANADYLRLASGIFDYNAGYTVMCWAYPVSNPTAQLTLFSVANNGSNLDRLRSNSGGTTWSAQSIIGGTSVTTIGSSVSYGAWQHWAMVRRDSSHLDTYLNGVLDATSNQSVSGRAAAAQLDIGNTNAASAYFNGRVFAIKAWNVALTAAEIQEEMRTIRPVRLANLWGWWPGRPGSGERAKDYSGNGRNFTEGGTLTDEDAGPISWGMRSGRRIRSGGTQYNQALAGTLSSSGALVKRTGKTLAGTLTSTGALIKRAGKGLAGTLATNGTLVKQTSKRIAGTLTSSGVLATARVYLKAIGGTLTSSGALVKRTGKTLAGTLSSSGTLAKRTAKSVSGTLTSSGTLASARVYLKAIAGTLSMAGTLTKRTGKALDGTLPSAGALLKQTRKALAGALGLAGALAKRTGKGVAGTLGSLGGITIARALAYLRHRFRAAADVPASIPAQGRAFLFAADPPADIPSAGRSFLVAADAASEQL